MMDASDKAEQRLAEKMLELEKLERELAEQTQFLNRIQADYSRLRLEHAALSDSNAALIQELAQATQERDYLRQNLARFEEDLRALQNTRTVRTSRLLGQTLGSLKSKV